MPAVYDKHGIPIMVGDTLKVFHFVAARRREKRYMYKYVARQDELGFLEISHLNPHETRPYRLLLDGSTLPDYEIVQGYAGVPGGCDFRSRQRKPKEVAP